MEFEHRSVDSARLTDIDTKESHHVGKSTEHLVQTSPSASFDENWTRISDLAERRRIQNRLAQRNYRKTLKQRIEDVEKRIGKDEMKRPEFATSGDEQGFEADPYARAANIQSSHIDSLYNSPDSLPRTSAFSSNNPFLKWTPPSAFPDSRDQDVRSQHESLEPSKSLYQRPHLLKSWHSLIAHAVRADNFKPAILEANKELSSGFQPILQEEADEALGKPVVEQGPQPSQNFERERKRGQLQMQIEKDTNRLRKQISYSSNLRHSAKSPSPPLPKIAPFMQKSPSRSASRASIRSPTQNSEDVASDSGEIRLRIDTLAPITLQLNGSMKNCTLEFIPVGGGMAELVIKNDLPSIPEKSSMKDLPSTLRTEGIQVKSKALKLNALPELSRAPSPVPEPAAPADTGPNFDLLPIISDLHRRTAALPSEFSQACELLKDLKLRCRDVFYHVRITANLSYSQRLQHDEQFQNILEQCRDPFFTLYAEVRRFELGLQRKRLGYLFGFSAEQHLIDGACEVISRTVEALDAYKLELSRQAYVAIKEPAQQSGEASRSFSEDPQPHRSNKPSPASHPSIRPSPTPVSPKPLRTITSPIPRAYRQRRKDPSCDACRERKVKCDATETSTCSECSSRNAKCQFTKETNRRISSIKQVQDLQSQLAERREENSHLRSRVSDQESVTSWEEEVQHIESNAVNFANESTGIHSASQLGQQTLMAVVPGSFGERGKELQGEYHRGLRPTGSNQESASLPGDRNNESWSMLSPQRADRRRDQNRAAQRAYAERKGRHLNNLEEETARLEQSSQAVIDDHKALRAGLEALQYDIAKRKPKSIAEESVIVRIPDEKHDEEIFDNYRGTHSAETVVTSTITTGELEEEDLPAHLLVQLTSPSFDNWKNLRSELPESWKWDVEYQQNTSEVGGCWTCTPSEPEDPGSFPLTIAGAPVVLPVEYRWPPTGGVNPPPDPRPSAPIDCTAEMSVDTVRDLFLTFEGSIGFYLLINGLLQVIVSDGFDTVWASSHLPHKYGGLRVSYIQQTMEPTMIPTETETMKSKASGNSTHSRISSMFGQSRSSTATTAPRLKLNDFIEARSKSLHKKEKFSGRIGLVVSNNNQPYILMSTHIITEAILAKSHIASMFSRRERFEKLDDDWNEQVEIWAGNEKLGIIEKTFDDEAEVYPGGFKHDVTLIKPANPATVKEIRSPVSDLGWLSKGTWYTLRQRSSGMKILGDTESHRAAKTFKSSRPSDVLIVGEGIFLNQAASKPTRHHDRAVWNELISRAVLYRVYPDFDPPNGYSGIALYANGLRQDGTTGPGVVGFQSFVQRSGHVQNFEMEGGALDKRLAMGRVAFYGAFQVPEILKKEYSII